MVRERDQPMSRFQEDADLRRRMDRNGSFAIRTKRYAAAGRHPIAEVVDIHEIADHLGVSVRHVRRLVAERRVPYIKWGNLLRFDPHEISNWLANGGSTRSYRDAIDVPCKGRQIIAARE